MINLTGPEILERALVINGTVLAFGLLVIGGSWLIKRRLAVAAPTGSATAFVELPQSQNDDLPKPQPADMSADQALDSLSMRLEKALDGEQCLTKRQPNRSQARVPRAHPL
jgi:hypothetical protein